MDEDKLILVSVFSSNNNALFQVAKSILKKNRIKFFSSGDYLNVLNPAVYSSEIKVFEKDEEAARKLLSKLTSTPNQYIPSSKFEKYLVRNGIIIIVLLFLILSIIILLARK